MADTTEYEGLKGRAVGVLWAGLFGVIGAGMVAGEFLGYWQTNAFTSGLVVLTGGLFVLVGGYGVVKSLTESDFTMEIRSR